METKLNIDNFSTGQLKNIGNTSLIDLSSLSENDSVKIYAKIEAENPTGSIKDRVAKCLIFDAEKTGKLSISVVSIRSGVPFLLIKLLYLLDNEIAPPCIRHFQ